MIITRPAPGSVPEWYDPEQVTAVIGPGRVANGARPGSFAALARSCQGSHNPGAYAVFARRADFWQSGAHNKNTNPGAMPSSTPIRFPLIAAALVGAACFCLPAAAQVAPAGGFTFRRIAVAPQGGWPRITVQVDPLEQARRLAPPAPVAPLATPVALPLTGDAGAAPPGARFGWFWDRVSPNLAPTDGRFLAAMAALRDAPEGNRVPEPSVQHLQDIAAAHNAAILRATVGTRISPALALAVIAVESGGRPGAVSHAGAQGLMQLIPATAARFGVADAADPTQNVRGGVAYLDWLLNEFDGDLVLALAGYNAGEGAVRRAGGVPPFAETRDYVPRVLAAWQVARGLCATVPELPTDACVFAVRAVRTSG